MIFSLLNGDTFGFQHIESLFYCVVYQNLGGTFSELSLSVKHEAASKNIDLIHMGTRTVSASTGYFVVGLILDICPLVIVIMKLELSNFFIGVVVETTKKVAAAIAEGEGGVLSGCWVPVLNRNRQHFSVEGLLLLHTLDIGLETSSQLLSQLVVRNIITRNSSEQLWSITFSL